MLHLVEGVELATRFQALIPYSVLLRLKYVVALPAFNSNLFVLGSVSLTRVHQPCEGGLLCFLLGSVRNII
jgi:hypothetical protein